MKIISTTEAETDLQNCLAKIKKGEEFVISHNEIPIARLILASHGAESLSQPMQKRYGTFWLVLLIATIVHSFNLFSIVPRFESIFSDMLDGVQLPLITMKVIELSRWFRHWWWAIFPMLFLIAVIDYIALPKLGKRLSHFIPIWSIIVATVVCIAVMILALYLPVLDIIQALNP